MNDNKNIIWVDFIKVAATVSVVILHSSAPLLYKYNHLPLHHWWIGNLYDSTVRMCVPLFFMLSGYLLLGKTETLRTFFSKRANKVILPLIMWSVFYIIWRVYYEKDFPLSLNLFYKTLLMPPYYHLWFLYAIIGIYLYLPVLRIIVKYSGNIILYYLIALWILAASVIPFFEARTAVSSAFDLAALSGYTGYLILGYLLGQKEYSHKIFITAIFVAIACVLVTAMGTFYLTKLNNKFDDYFYGFLSMNVILLSVSIFLLLKYSASTLNLLQSRSLIKIIRKLSVTSLGIYLIHPAFLALLKNGIFGFRLSAFSGNPLYSVPVTAGIVFILSFISISILRQIPVLKRSVP